MEIQLQLLASQYGDIRMQYFYHYNQIYCTIIYCFLIAAEELTRCACLACRHFNNAFFARVGGVSVLELNRLELEFLFRLDFRLSVTISVFESYCSYLEKEVMTFEKKTERVDRSLPAFGSAPPTPGELSPRFKKRVSPGLHKSQINTSQLSLQYQRSIANMIAGDSPPSR